MTTCQSRAAPDRQGDDLHISPFREDGVADRDGDLVHGAYRVKYRGSPYISSIKHPRPSALRVRITETFIKPMSA